MCDSKNLLIVATLPRTTWGDAWGERVVGAVQQVRHRDGDYQDWQVRNTLSCFVASQYFMIPVNDQRWKIKLQSRGDAVEKERNHFCKYEVFPFGCSSSELFMRRGIMTMQPLWIKRLHSLHFRGRIHYPSMEKVYQRMEWTERRWDDQMYRRRTFSDSSQRGRRLQPSEYEWDGDRAPSKLCPTTGRSDCRHSRTTFWGKTAAKSPPGRYVTMWWKAPAWSALACLKGFLHAKESSYINPCQHDWWLIS